ncbi:MAG: YfhO family protein [Caldilineaceae bacterium]|nr:YfhO family protein [Caldilineaceae bacterium]
MSGFAMGWSRWLREPFGLGFVLLLLLITLFLAKPLFTDQALIAADLLFELDPLWQPLAPPDFRGPANQVLSDQVLQFYPWQKFIRAELAQDRLPLWNPTVNAGHPLLANAQSALFDPFNLIALLWPLAKSFVVVAFLRLLCAGTFTLLLALELGLSRMAAYLSMVVFAFAGPQIVWLLYPKASVLVWLPALLYLSARLIHTGKWQNVTWLGLAMAAQLLGGHPETSFYLVLVWLAFVSYWLWPVVRRGKAPTQPRRAVMQLALAGVLGMGVAMIQWLHLAETLLQSEILSTRSQAALSWQSIFWQWREWLAALTMLMPEFFGNPRHQSYWYPFSNYTEQTLFAGVLPVGLALLVVIAGWRRPGSFALNPHQQRQVTFLMALGGIMLGFALRLPGFPLLAELPGLSVTNPGRLRGVYILIVALLAGYGLDFIRQSLATTEDGKKQFRPTEMLARLLIALAVGAALIAAGAYAGVTLYFDQLVELGRSQAAAAQGNPFFFRPLAEYLLLAQVRVEQMQAAFHPVNWRMYLPLFIVLVTLAVVATVRRLVRTPARRAEIISLVIVGLIVGELWLFGADFNPTIAPQWLYPIPELVGYLTENEEAQPDEPYRVMGTGLALLPNVGMVFGLEDVRGYDPVALRRYMQLMARLEGASRVGHHLLFTQAAAPLLDFLNVRYAFSASELSEEWRPLRERHGVTLYANQQAMARAFMVYTSQGASTPNESLEMMLAPDFDFRKSVILEAGSAPVEIDLQGVPAVPPQVAISRDAPGEMTVQVDTATPGILVLSEPYMPGWVATVNQQEAEILIANHAFRAVPLPAGSHTVRFAYRPASFVAGACISGISLALLILILIFLPEKQGAKRETL